MTPTTIFLLSMVGELLVSLAFTVLLATFANRFLRRPLLAGAMAGLVATLLASLIGEINDLTTYFLYWLIFSGISALIVKSRVPASTGARKQQNGDRPHGAPHGGRD